MKRILPFALLVVALLSVYLLSPWSPVKSSLFVGGHRHHCAAECLPELYVEGEEALRSDDLATGRRYAAKGQQEARDSDEYYRYVVLEAKCHFYNMQADSFLMTHRRLKQYLQRQQREDIELKMLQVECDMQMGVYLTKMAGLADSAQAYNFKALRLAEQLSCYDNDRLLILNNIADAYKQMGHYDKCIEYYNAAMELGDTLGMSVSTRIALTSGIASAYSALHSFQESDMWWNRLKQLEPQMSKGEHFNYLNNRGNDYYLQEDYEQSLGYFLRLDSLTKDDPDMLWERMFCFCNLSGVYIKMGKTDLALPLLEQAERFFTEQNQPVPLFYLTTQRIEMALLRHNLAEAGRLASENPTPSWMIPEQVMLRQEILIRLYEQTQQWQLLADQLKHYHELKTAIAGENVRMRLAETLMRYEHEKSEMTKQRLMEEREELFRWTLASLIAAVLLVILLCVVILQKRREEKMKDALTKSRIQSLRMETVRNRITPHFIGNALSAEMMAQAEGHEVDFDAIVELLHRGIELTGTELTTLSDELEFIGFYCDIESRSIGPDFHYEATVAADVDPQHVTLPAMSVQILVENAIKHGLKRKSPVAGQRRSVCVSVARKGAATLVEVRDNGVGLMADWQKKERTGLRVIHQTLDMLNEQNKEQIGFGLENSTGPAGVTGCRAWLLLPDHYEYKLKTV